MNCKRLPRIFKTQRKSEKNIRNATKSTMFHMKQFRK
nr:MAG TPA: hypothetical protein [Bacteriophage sp.]